MILKNNEEIDEVFVEEPGASFVKKKVLIGPEEGSDNIIMRHFSVLPGGNTPYHIHPHEHIVKIEKGRGVVVDYIGHETEVKEGQSLFIPGNEKHQFRNPHQEAFEFLCIILNPNR
ncbi:MAG: cupin domain-containing protein [Candidatus Aminicenantes bacterium]|nr:cupin domain-containing protein [Candidatus Aminicenantes bacterium]